MMVNLWKNIGKRGEESVMDLLIDTNIILDMVLKREKY